MFELDWKDRFTGNCAFYALQDLIRAEYDAGFRMPPDGFEAFQSEKTKAEGGIGLSTERILPLWDKLLDETHYRVGRVVISPRLKDTLLVSNSDGSAQILDPRTETIDKLVLTDQIPCVMLFTGARDGGPNHFACVTREETIDQLSSFYDSVDMVTKIERR